MTEWKSNIPKWRKSCRIMGKTASLKLCVYVCVRVCMCLCCACVYMCMHVCEYMCMSVHACVCMCMHECVCVPKEVRWSHGILWNWRYSLLGAIQNAYEWGFTANMVARRVLIQVSQGGNSVQHDSVAGISSNFVWHHVVYFRHI